LLRLALTLTLAALLAVPLAQGGSTVVPYAGFYDCRARDLTHVVDIQLRVNGRYTLGFVDASKHRFKSVIGAGRFSRRGSRLTFHNGPMRPMYAIVKTQRKFGVWTKGERYYSYYCYLNK
jgi:hypothetical protein